MKYEKPAMEIIEIIRKDIETLTSNGTVDDNDLPGEGGDWQ